MKTKKSIRYYAEKGQPIENAFIIDFHGHIGPYRAFYNPGVSADDLLAMMDRMGIDMSVQFSNAVMSSDHVLGNKAVKEVSDLYPDRIIPFAAVNPRYPEEASNELKYYCGECGWKGIKIHPSGNNYPVNGKLYAPIWEFAAEHSRVVISHSWDEPTCNALAFDEVATNYPDVTIVLAHCIMPDFKGAVELALKHPNIYLELTAAAPLNGLIEWMTETIGVDKIIYGSDLGGWFSPGHGMGPILYADIPDDDKCKILGANAAKILKINEINRN
jgi:predicted TIM-barrel fold metal-dependent hydrolase